MIKKIFKLLLKLIVGIIVLSIVVYFSFLGWEYMTGGKFVGYLKNNSETVEISDSFSYQLMESDIKNSKLILGSEIHGFKEPTKFDIDFFKHLHKNFGVRTYIAELDYVQASLMNTFLETGNDTLLHRILKNWVVVQGRNNKDYYDKYKAFHTFYKQLPENEKFKFIGIDKIQDIQLMTDFVNELSRTDSLLSPIMYDKETVIKQLQERINQLKANDDINLISKFELEYLLKNLSYKENKKGREESIFQNFYDVYNEFDLKSQKVYGYFGAFHVMQYRVNGSHPLASKIRQSDLGLANQILSINFLFVDSYMVMESKQLPEFMRSEGKYSKMPISSDNILFMYIYGIKDFKRLTPENHKSLIKLNGENSPYENSGRLTNTFRLLPVIPTFELTDKGKPYVQYTIFIRNGDWAEPFEN